MCTVAVCLTVLLLPLATGNAVTLCACYHIFTTVSTDRPPHTYEYVYDKAQNLKTLCMWFEARPRGVGITAQVSAFAIAVPGSVGFLDGTCFRVVFGWLSPFHGQCCLAACTSVPVFSLRAVNPRAVGGPLLAHPLLFSFGMIRFLTFSIWLLCIWVLFRPPFVIMK